MRIMPIWQEDDALTPDRETLSEAIKRIFGKRAADYIIFNDAEDRDDELVVRITLEIVWSHPGATGIYLIKDNS